MGKPENVFEAIIRYGDGDFSPMESADEELFYPTDAPAGSAEKIEELRRRVLLGLPLWHPEDRVDYGGLTGAVQPRHGRGVAKVPLKK